MYFYPKVMDELKIGDIVEHKNLPGVPLVLAKGPLEGIRGTRWIVQTPEGKQETALEENLIR